MEIIELHHLISLCRSETDAFDYLSKKKKEHRGNTSPFL